VRLPSITSFGQATNGDIYVLSDGGTIARVDPA
jgi:hypothetical protein